VCKCICVCAGHMCVNVYVFVQDICVKIYMCLCRTYVCKCICVCAGHMCVNVYVFVQDICV
jgi:hypothetical protein